MVIASKLSRTELDKLSKVLLNLEISTLSRTGYNMISGSFAISNLCDYNDDIINVELTFGCQSDTTNSIHTEEYKICRYTFEITQ